MSLLTVDGCNNYTVLSEADRAQGHIVINASNYRSDRDDLVPGWYRFQGAAGDRMADKCVPANLCGTRYPGWLNGTHPTVSEGVVTRRVCVIITSFVACTGTGTCQTTAVSRVTISESGTAAISSCMSYKSLLIAICVIVVTAAQVSCLVCSLRVSQ